MYYTERKLKNENGGGLGTRLDGKCIVTVSLGRVIKKIAIIPVLVPHQCKNQ